MENLIKITVEEVEDDMKGSRIKEKKNGIVKNRKRSALKKLKE